MSNQEKKNPPSRSGGGRRNRQKQAPAGRPLPRQGALSDEGGYVYQGQPTVGELAEMVAAERLVIDELRGSGEDRASELVAHERTLRMLLQELRHRTAVPPAPPATPAAHGPVNISPHVMDFLVPGSHRGGVGKAVTAAKRAVLRGLKPFHMELLRPQHRFNEALIASLNDLLALQGKAGARQQADGIWSRLVPLANPTAWSVSSHRSVGTGALVALAKRSYLSALGPVLRELFRAQAAWNAKAVEALARLARRDGTPPTAAEAASAKELLSSLWRLSDPFNLPGLSAGVRAAAPLWREVLRRQHRFNEQVTEQLRLLLGANSQVRVVELSPYEEWCARVEPEQRAEAEREAEELESPPLISVVAVGTNVSEAEVRATLGSLLKQSYGEWELCIASTGTVSRKLSTWVEMQDAEDERIHIVTESVGNDPARAYEAARALAQGEIIAFMELGDELAPHALAEVARRTRAEIDFDVLYADEDQLDENRRRREPFFKPDWSPDLLRSCHYWGSLLVVRRSLLERVGGHQPGLVGFHGYDLALRLSEQTQRITHVPRVLLHRRATAPGPLANVPVPQAGPGRRVLAEHLRRLGEQGEALVSPSGTLRVRYPVQGTPRVSIIVPFKDKPELLETLVTSFVKYTRYPNVELLLISNNSTKPETFALLETLTDPRIRKLTWDHPFNYSAINNFGVEQATGELLLFLNNDIEVIEEGWLEELIGQAQRPEVGLVGARLLFPDGTLQHAGVVVGLGGYAGHPFTQLAPTASTPMGRADWTRNYLAVTGACVMMRRTIFEQLEGFDECFIVCGSDVELGLRAVEHGLRVVYTPHATLIHHESATRKTDSIPENDFWRSYVAYRRWLYGGDPFYNANLTLLGSDGSFRGTEDAQSLAIQVLLGELPSSRVDDVTAARANHVRHLSGQVRALDYSVEVVERSRAEAPRQLAALRSEGLRRVTWFVPGFGHPYGGVHTILRFGDLLKRRHGVENTIVIYDTPRVTPREMEARIAPLFPEPPGQFHIIQRSEDLAGLPPSDLAIATLWTSAYVMLQYPRAKARAYFIQDFEPLFYPAGSYYALAEQTYRMGFYGIFNTQGLHDHVTANYPMEGCWFEPTVERSVFHARRPARKGPVRLFFYARPSTDRNAFELGLATLSQLKKELGNAVEIVTAGEKWDPAVFGVQGVIHNYGILPYEKTGDLYRECDVGLCFMFTKHPSYLPFEMMACGVTVVTNDNPANLWLLEHEKNCLLAEPTYSCVLTQLRHAVQDASLRARISAAAVERVTRTTWEEQVDKVYAALMGLPVSRAELPHPGELRQPVSFPTSSFRAGRS
ncbi:glycosyltransferase [Hyalangium minutum]|uniref:Glycosyl transferase, group 2 family protein n=1 Tax=Hyalangium minutum TaxID=394096 RepID=A0A085WF99_9BACT|nr:glycosyltransferase [Hyalangium minutum]KFE66362.1 glycosyl transferase, group 2 family protein [Hyalangium minutum]